MNAFLQNFKLELLGTIVLSSYLAWIIWALIGQILATLVRNHLTTLKSYPFNFWQIITGVLIVIVFIRFSFELTGLIPTAFGAFGIGLGGNELALAFLKKYLNRKKDELGEKQTPVANIPDDIGGGGIQNPKP